MTVQGDGHVLDVRMLRFWNQPHREEAAMLAQALLTGGRVDEALGVTEEALGRDPTDADLLLVRGRAWLLRGNLERAQQLFVRAARLEPGWAEPWRWLGELLLRRGRFAKALEVLDRAQAMEPDDAEIGELRRRASRMHGIEARLARFTADPATEDAALLAQELLDLDRPAEALDVLEMALADDPDDPDAHLLQARALFAGGLPESARAALERAMRADPTWEEPRRLFEEMLGEPAPVHVAEEVPATDADLDAFLATLSEDCVSVLPEVNDTAVGVPAPVTEPNAWALHRGRPRPRLRAGAGRSYLPPPPSRVFPTGPGWE